MIKAIEHWKDHGADYIEISVSDNERVCVKKPDNNSAYMYVMQCSNGYEVYKDHIGPEQGHRNLSKKEYNKVIETEKNIGLTT